MSAIASKHHEQHGAGLNEWLTPRPILDALGTFDLDPAATCSMAHDGLPWSTARKMICKCRDGLAAKWTGRVWLNPPYDRHAGQWMQKLALHEDGGIGLVMGRFETQWFRRAVWGWAQGILFLHERIRFMRPDGTPYLRKAGGAGGPGAGSCLVAYGEANVKALERCRLGGELVKEWAIIPKAQL